MKHDEAKKAFNGGEGMNRKSSVELERMFSRIVDLEEVATRPSYREIAKAKYAEMDGRATYDQYMELRQYPACKRTVEIEGGRYFIQFPSFIFLWTGLKYRERANTRAPYVSFSAFVAKDRILTPKDLVYRAPMPNVFEHGRVCMPTPNNPNADNMVETFWQSAFRSYDYSNAVPRACLENNFGGLAQWQRLKLQQVEERLRYEPMAVEEMIKNHWMHPYEWFGG